MNPHFPRRLLFAAVVWLLLTGDAIIKCSSDPGGFDLGNRPPVAADSFFTVAANGSLTGFMQATDPDDDLLLYRVVAQPRLGILRDVDSRTGQFTYEPGEVGTDSFSFRANDGHRDSNTAVVTIQILDAALGSSAMKASGALQVADDPAIPGAMIVLWDDPRKTLQRVYRGQPIEPQGLTAGLSGFALDALWPGAMLGYRDDGGVVRTEDGGLRWRTIPGAGTRCPPVPGAAARRDAGRPCPRLPDNVSASTGGDAGADAGVSVLVDRYRSGGWWLALSDSETRVLYSADDGLRWKLALELDMPDLRLADCGERSLCLLDVGGHHLWRFPAER